jgi:hypothetical protein
MAGTLGVLGVCRLGLAAGSPLRAGNAAVALRIRGLDAVDRHSAVPFTLTIPAGSVAALGAL